MAETLRISPAKSRAFALSWSAKHPCESPKHASASYCDTTAMSRFHIILVHYWAGALQPMGYNSILVCPAASKGLVCTLSVPFLRQNLLLLTVKHVVNLAVNRLPTAA